MPTVLRSAGFRFFFFSNERAEPSHVHIQRGDAHAKVWLNPVALTSWYGFNSRELAQILALVREHETLLVERWHAHFKL